MLEYFGDESMQDGAVAGLELADKVLCAMVSFRQSSTRERRNVHVAPTSTPNCAKPKKSRKVLMKLETTTKALDAWRLAAAAWDMGLSGEAPLGCFTMMQRAG